MTDLQVRYQQLEHEKAKLEEDKRLHDAQIMQAHATAHKLAKEEELVDANVQKALADAGLTQAELAWYGTKTVSEIYKNYATGTGSVLKGIGSLIPG